MQLWSCCGWKRPPRTESPGINPTEPNASDKLWVEIPPPIPPFSDSVVATSFLIYFELLCLSPILFPLSVVA